MATRLSISLATFGYACCDRRMVAAEHRVLGTPLASREELGSELPAPVLAKRVAGTPAPHDGAAGARSLARRALFPLPQAGASSAEGDIRPLRSNRILLHDSCQHGNDGQS